VSVVFDQFFFVYFSLWQAHSIPAYEAKVRTHSALEVIDWLVGWFHRPAAHNYWRLCFSGGCSSGLELSNAANPSCFINRLVPVET